MDMITAICCRFVDLRLTLLTLLSTLADMAENRSKEWPFSLDPEMHVACKYVPLARRLPAGSLPPIFTLVLTREKGIIGLGQSSSGEHLPLLEKASHYNT